MQKYFLHFWGPIFEHQIADLTDWPTKFEVDLA